MFLLLNILWLIRTSKFVLFWIYLWQLKEYHVSRFLDHFKTYKGKKLFFNYFLLSKIILLLLFVFSPWFFSLWFYALFLIYLAETLLFFWQIARKNIKKPVKTLKAVFLLAVCLVIAGFFASYVLAYLAEDLQPAWLLLFDILLPLIVSFAVLLFQPVFVVLRNNILKKAAEKIRGLKNLKVICVTGSYGKTSTKEFLTAILSKKFKTLCTKEHQNSEIGIARRILDDLKQEHQVFIAEVGAYNKGKVKEACSMLKPEIGIVTGVNEQHLSLFGSMKNLLSAEGGRELAGLLPENGVLILNGDNKYCIDLYRKSDNFTKARKKIYSTDKNKIVSDLRAEDSVASKNAISFVVVDNPPAGGRNLMHFSANVLGLHNVQNLLASILTARELGMSFEEISDAFSDLKPEYAGMILKNGKHGIIVIDSSYSANLDGVLADLDYLSIYPQKKVIIMPSLIELGQKSAEIHEKIGRKIGQICDMVIITSKDKFEDIKKGAVGEGMQSKDVLLCDKPQDIFSIITLFCKAGDAVLLEGRVPEKLVKFLVVN